MRGRHRARRSYRNHDLLFLLVAAGCILLLAARIVLTGFGNEDISSDALTDVAAVEQGLGQDCWWVRPGVAVVPPDGEWGGAVIPLPKQLECSGGDGLSLDDSTVVVLDKASFTSSPGQAVVLRKAFRQHFQCLFRFPMPERTEASGSPAIVLVYNSSLPDEGYSLRIEASRLVLEAKGRIGVLYALQTLRQLQPRRGGPLPACTIEDRPRYRWRGLHLDVARHFFDVAEVKRVLVLMSMYKMNVLHLHLSDDQGWRVEVTAHPELVLVGGRRGRSLNNPKGFGGRVYNGTAYPSPRFFSQRELRELDSMAASLGISIVPEVDVPGHTAAMIIAARTVGLDIGAVEIHEGCTVPKEFTEAPNCLGGNHGIIVPTNTALEYLEKIFDELATVFTSPYFHIGGDEAEQFRDSVYDKEEGRTLEHNLGIRNHAALQGYLVDKVHSILRRHGKTVIAWDDTFFELEGYTPPEDMAVMWWRDWSPRAKIEDIRRLNRSVILTPVSAAYLDMFQMEPHTASKYRVQEGTVPLDRTYGIGYLDAGRKTLGVQGCLWSETFTSLSVLEYQAFPRALAIAEAGWTQRSRLNYTSFVDRWERHKLRLLAMGVNVYTGK